MSSVPANDDEKPARWRIVAAIILALLAMAFIVVAFIYATTPDYRLPGFLGFAHSRAHHSLRMVGSVLIGIAFALGSWFALRYRSLALEEARIEEARLEEAREAERAAAAEAEQAAALGGQVSQPEDPGQKPTTAVTQA